MALTIRPQSVNVPLPRPRPMDIGEVPLAPSVEAARAPVAAPVDPLNPVAPAAGGAVSDDPALSVPPPPTGTDPYWGGVAQAAQQYKPGGEHMLVAGLQGFLNAKSASDKIKQQNEEQAYERAREEEEWKLRKEDHALSREDRLYNRKASEEDRALRREEIAWNRALRERQEGRADNAERRADEDQDREAKAFDYEQLSRGIAIQNALDKMENGERIDATDMKNLADGERAELQNLEDDLEMSDEEKSAKRMEIRDRYTRARAQAGAYANAGNGAGRGGSTDVIQKGDMGGNPGAVMGGNEEQIGTVPPAEEESGSWFGEDGLLSGVDDAIGSAADTIDRWTGKPTGEPAAPAPRTRESDFFVKPPKFSGTGTKDDPLTVPGTPLSDDEMAQVMYLYLKPGQWIMHNGRPITRLQR